MEADKHARIATLEAKMAEARAIVLEGYGPPEVKHADSCVWASKQTCQCGSTEAAWYTHAMNTLDRLAKSLEV